MSLEIGPTLMAALLNLCYNGQQCLTIFQNECLVAVQGRVNQYLRVLALV